MYGTSDFIRPCLFDSPPAVDRPKDSGVRAPNINSRVQEVVQSVYCHHPQPRWHSRKRHDTKYSGCSVAGCLYRWEPWFLSGRRSDEQRAKDGRYQVTVDLRSVDKMSSAGHVLLSIAKYRYVLLSIAKYC